MKGIYITGKLSGNVFGNEYFPLVALSVYIELPSFFWNEIIIMFV